jgi:ribose 1,5-bisphosphokinase
VILVTASPEAIASRLVGRGRENTEEIANRIARTAELNTNLENCIEIQNDGAIELAGNELVNLISVTEKQLA